MINPAEYIHNLALAPKLFEKLKEKIFLKTEIDVVYSDITNWERADLLYISNEEDKGNWKKISYTEYVWIKIVEQLNDFGCDNNVIIRIKNIFIVNLNLKSVLKKANECKDLIEEAKMSEELVFLNENLTEEDLEMSLGYTYLDLIIANTIIKKEQISFFFDRSSPDRFMIFSNDLMKAYERNDSLDLIQDFFNYPFLSIPLSTIISKFIDNGDKNLSFENQLAMIITDQEHKLLKVIRKKFNEIKSLKIKFNDGEIELIEITSVKKVALESRLMNHIKKGDYQKIIIDTVDGKIVNFENTQKIKM